MTQAPSAHRLDRLDHLRAFAALMVLCWHGISSAAPGTLGPLSILREGHTGVSLFCVISGFIFTYVYFDAPPAYGRFLYKRALRIGPMLILYMALSYYTSGMTLRDIALILTGTSKYGSGFAPIFTQGWSLVIEVQFYLLFPFLLLFTIRCGPITLFGWLLLAIMLRLSIYHLTETAQPAAYWSIFGRIDQFLVGMICGTVLKLGWLDRSLFRRGAVTAGALGFVGLLAFFWWWHDKVGGFLGSSSVHASVAARLWVVLPTIEAVLYGLILTGYVLAPHRHIPVLQPISSAWAFVGRISYSIYVNQMLILSWRKGMLERLYPNLWVHDWWGAFASLTVSILPALLALSALTYWLIEKPFMELRPHRVGTPIS